MDYENLLLSFIQGWKATRGETIEILNSLDDNKLQFKPEGEEWQPLYWEFGCIGRTQVVYTKAVETGKIDFSLFTSPALPLKTEYQTKDEILKFLGTANDSWLDVIEKKGDCDYKIDWGDTDMPLVRHIASLSEHERLHHGQFISYFTIARFKLPEGFKANWALSS